MSTPEPPFTPFRGARIAVVGLGRAGLPAALRLVEWGAEVEAWDDGEAARRAAEQAGLTLHNPAEGRSAVTGNDAERFNFKVPTLRNVELTYPYFHDGAADTLAEAVDTMGRIQLGRKFSDKENADIVAFLKTLTGDQPRIAMPILPPSSDKTKRPQPFE